MLKKITLRTLDLAGIDPNARPILAALVDAAAARAVIETANYYDPRGPYDANGVRAFRADCRAVRDQWAAVKVAVHEAGILHTLDDEILAVAKGGRWEWKDGHWDYCPGQYYPMEFRGAAARIIEEANRQHRRAQDPTEREPANMEDLKRLNKQNGGCWFGPGEMRFFGTRIESGILPGHRFITSEQPPNGPRKYSVRSFDNKGDIDTVGDFCGYNSKADALAAAKTA